MQLKSKICDNCKKLSIIWKSSGTGGKKLCRQCSNNTGVAKLSIKPTAKLKSITSHSQKRTKEERIYIAKRILFLKEHEMCMIHISGICMQKANEIHHSYSGKDRNQYYLDSKTWYATCRGCHKWVHLNSKQARELGFLK